jgi:hypothetical protein
VQIEGIWSVASDLLFGRFLAFSFMFSHGSWEPAEKFNKTLALAHQYLNLANQMEIMR